jgi:hypothetical protein
MSCERGNGVDLEFAPDFLHWPTAVKGTISKAGSTDTPVTMKRPASTR